MFRYRIIIIIFLLSSKLLSQELYFDDKISGPAIGLSKIDIDTLNAFSGNLSYTFYGRHAFSFNYAVSDQRDYNHAVRTYSFNYTGIIHETYRKPKLHFQVAASIGYTYVTAIESNIISAGVSFFKRFKFKYLIIIPIINGSYNYSFKTAGLAGIQFLSQNILQYGGSLGLGILLGKEKKSVIAITPSFSKSKEKTMTSFTISMSINSITK